VIRGGRKARPSAGNWGGGVSASATTTRTGIGSRTWPNTSTKRSRAIRKPAVRNGRKAPSGIGATVFWPFTARKTWSTNVRLGTEASGSATRICRVSWRISSASTNPVSPWDSSGRAVSRLSAVASSGSGSGALAW
jgi:hypothetical protein